MLPAIAMRILIVAATVASQIGVAAAQVPAHPPAKEKASAAVVVSKLVVTPYRLTYGRNKGKVSVKLAFTTTKKSALERYASLVIKMTCRVESRNHTASVRTDEMNKADVGKARRDNQHIFVINPLVREPNKCNVAFMLQRGFRRNATAVRSYCYTGPGRLSQKACKNMRAPIVAQHQIAGN